MRLGQGHKQKSKHVHLLCELHIPTLCVLHIRWHWVPEHVAWKQLPRIKIGRGNIHQFAGMKRGSAPAPDPRINVGRGEFSHLRA